MFSMRTVALMLPYNDRNQVSFTIRILGQSEQDQTYAREIELLLGELKYLPPQRSLRVSFQLIHVQTRTS
jgi:hypothetical protein